MTAVASPWTFDVHPGPWLVVLVLGVGYALLIRRERYRATRRQIASYYGALALLAVATTWPLADLARSWLLTALIVQRLILLVGVPPLLVLGLPPPLVAAVTRPAPIDAALRWCSRPPVAVILVTVVAIGTLTVGAVQLQASSGPGRAAMDLVLLGAGVVLWAPVLNRFPGTEHPSLIGKVGYLVVQSIVPSFLALVFIFAHHPLYPAYGSSHHFASLSPVTDQMVAGFVAKLGTIAVLWTVAFALLYRAPSPDDDGSETEPLTWIDVERQLERVERSERRRQ